MPTAFRCDDCALDFTRIPPAHGLIRPFTVEGVPGVHVDGCHGRLADGVFIPEAAVCPGCRRLALRTELRDLALHLGWQPPGPATAPADLCACPVMTGGVVFHRSGCPHVR